jgi:hypothetical protein
MIAPEILVTTCTVQLEQLQNAARNGPLLDWNFNCRACGKSAGEHTSESRIIASETLVTTCTVQLEQLQNAARDGPLLDWSFKCRVCGKLAGEHTSESRIIASETLVTPCTVQLEQLQNAARNGPLIDWNFNCRVCGKLAGEHTSQPTALPTIAQAQLVPASEMAQKRPVYAVQMPSYMVPASEMAQKRPVDAVQMPSYMVPASEMAQKRPVDIIQNRSIAKPRSQCIYLEIIICNADSMEFEQDDIGSGFNHSSYSFRVEIAGKCTSDEDLKTFWKTCTHQNAKDFEDLIEAMKEVFEQTSNDFVRSKLLSYYGYHCGSEWFSKSLPQMLPLCQSNIPGTSFTIKTARDAIHNKKKTETELGCCMCMCVCILYLIAYPVLFGAGCFLDFYTLHPLWMLCARARVRVWFRKKHEDLMPMVIHKRLLKTIAELHVQFSRR